MTERTEIGSDRRGWSPSSDSERQEVREELQRVLSSPSFIGSKRCSNLLRFVVEHSLSRPSEPLKELTLGVEVFGKPPLYSTDADNTVRTAACDVRKRLAQYYVGSGQESKIRIDLPSGSYLPEFKRTPETDLASEGVPKQRARSFRWFAPLSIAVLLIAAALSVWLWPKRDVIDDFWGPVWAQGDSVLVVVRTLGWETWDGATSAARPTLLPRTASTLTEQTQAESVYLSDAVSLARLSGLLQAHGKRWRVKRAELTTFTDLKASPAVLVGSPSHPWTRRLSDQLRFSFQRDETTRTSWIQDQRAPLRRDWQVNHTKPYDQVYGLISRVLDNTTGRTVVAVEGVSRYGTQAASEFVTDPAYLTAAFSQMPGSKEARNIQVVITAKLIDGVPGQPRILAVHSW